MRHLGAARKHHGVLTGASRLFAERVRKRPCAWRAHLAEQLELSLGLLLDHLGFVSDFVRMTLKRSLRVVVHRSVSLNSVQQALTSTHKGGVKREWRQTHASWGLSVRHWRATCLYAALISREEAMLGTCSSEK